MSERTAGSLVAVIIEDDAGVRSLLDEVFTAAGFRTFLAGSGEEGLAAIEAHGPVITTLDINLPGIDGFEVARRIRRISSTFIIMLSALAEESDVVLGLTSGADEYLVKPFRPRELRARIEALLRRPRLEEPGAPQTARAADASSAATVSTWRGRVHFDLSLDLDTRVVLVAQRRVDLTPTEFELLSTLLASKRRVCSKTELALGLRGVAPGELGHVSEPDKRAIETHIANLRRKLGDSAADPRYIETVRGVGYRLTPEDPSL
ncbi:response regulator transcription factor [Microbacterium sp. PMB16]|uniref:response regulator transcription factor n=1 Tax=Microbacterium sp. PMB16 TaxID=3120157 RepID=UPI003F4BB1C3